MPHMPESLPTASCFAASSATSKSGRRCRPSSGTVSTKSPRARRKRTVLAGMFSSARVPRGRAMRVHSAQTARGRRHATPYSAASPRSKMAEAYFNAASMSLRFNAG